MAASGVALITLLVLITSVTGLPHVGLPSFLLAQHLGVDPLPRFANPVYGWMIHLVALVFGGSAIYAINLFSAVCASGVVAMVFLHSYRAAAGFNLEHTFAPPAMHRVQLAAGVLSSLYLLAASPFMLAATRTSPLMFDLLLVLIAFYLVLTFGVGGRFSRIGLASLIYGVAMVEFTTAIVLAPLFAVLVLARLWQAGVFIPRLVLQALGCGLAGMSLYFVQAGLFMASPAYVWREFDGFWQVVWYILVEQKQSLTGGLPRVGWLTLSLVSFVPWVITLSFRLTGGSGRKSGAVIGTGAMYLMLIVLSVLLLLPNFPLSPANLTGTGMLFVTPYIFISLWVGHMVAFWLVTCFREKRFESVGMKKARGLLGRVLVTALPVFLLYSAATVSYPQSRDPAEQLAYEFSKHVVDAAADKEWLITNTLLDEQIAIESHIRGLPLKVIRLSYGRSVAQMKYVASLLEGDPRMQSLARVGMSPLMDEWFFQMPDVEKNTAVVHVPDMWLMAGFDAVPDRVLFTGIKGGAALPLDELLGRHQAFWDDYGRRVTEQEIETDRPSGQALAWISTHLSKIANNLGVYLEDQSRSDDAYASYQKARELAPDNLSALMNMHVLAQREKRPEFEALEEELTKATEKVMGKVQTWSLSYVYGFVRVPELFANRGIAFAMSGKASMAISDMKRALSLSEQNPQVQLALAGLYFGQSRDVESREQYEDVLANDPANIGALIGLMRVSVRNGDFDQARRHLEALRKTNIKPSVLKMDEAVLESLSGSPALAMKLLREVVKEQPDNMQAWAAIAVTAAQMKNTEAGEEAMDKLREAKMLAPGIQLVMAQSAIDQGDRDTGRRYLADILRRQPNNIPALEMTLRLDMFEGGRDMVQRSVEKILNADPRNALANYMLGVNHYYNEEYALAESAYRASIETARSPQALNDLAYVLYLQGKLAEGETAVRESLALNDRNNSAWDTLGVILMEQNKLTEAEEALQRSLGLRPNAASVLLSLAVLYEKSEKWDEAGKIAHDINTRLNELSPQDQGRLQRLIDRLTDRAAAM